MKAKLFFACFLFIINVLGYGAELPFDKVIPENVIEQQIAETGL
jgi:hypothetical protein